MSRAWGKPPSLWWGLSGKRWTDQDRLLTLAFSLHEEAMCSGCGQPKDQAYGSDVEGVYDVHEVKCGGCAALQSNSANKQPEPGAKQYVEYEAPPEG